MTTVKTDHLKTLSSTHFPVIISFKFSSGLSIRYCKQKLTCYNVLYQLTVMIYWEWEYVPMHSGIFKLRFCYGRILLLFYLNYILVYILTTAGFKTVIYKTTCKT